MRPTEREWLIEHGWLVEGDGEPSVVHTPYTRPPGAVVLELDDFGRRWADVEIREGRTRWVQPDHDRASRAGRGDDRAA